MEDKFSELTPRNLQALGLEGTKSHFSHTHQLRLYQILDGNTPYCNCCNKSIREPIPAYCCVDCEFCIHICCADIKEDDLKAQLEQPPFYKQHNLRITLLSKGESRDCKACTRKIRGVSLSSSRRNYPFDLHVSCIKPPQRALKYKSHRHSLFYFKDKSLGYLKCCVCGKECEGSFYRCLMCDKNFHVGCIPLPHVVKSDKSHNHPLVLCGSLKSVYDGEEYSCHVCDKPGNPGHHAYYCHECKFIAHIECVISEEDPYLKNGKNQNDYGPEKSNAAMEFQPVSEEDMVAFCNSHPKRGLKHESHEHNLFYFMENGDNYGNLSCKICSKKCKGGLYWCPKCRVSYHIDCIPLPRNIVIMEHTIYSISLVLLDAVIDDASDHNQHCVFCKETANSENHIYYCQELKFFAHIECSLVEGSIMSSTKKLLPFDPKSEEESVDELQDSDTAKEIEIEADEGFEPHTDTTKEKDKKDGPNEPVEPSITKEALKGFSSRGFGNKGFVEKYVKPTAQKLAEGARNFDKNLEKRMSPEEDYANSNAPSGQSGSNNAKLKIIPL